jgi:hypothetical protein
MIEVDFFNACHEQVRHARGDLLLQAIDAAKNKRFPRPANPAALNRISADIRRQAGVIAGDVQNDLRKATKTLKEAWHDKAGDAAERRLSAEATELDELSKYLVKMAGIVEKLAMELDIARQEDVKGLQELARAHQEFEESEEYARLLAETGVGWRLAATVRYLDSSDRAERDLNQLTSEARLSQLAGSGLSPEMKLDLINASMPGAVPGHDEILTPNDLRRASQFIGKLSAKDRAIYDNLLRNAKSDDERAYITKAVAAGHSMKEVAAFDRLIHRHGGNETWMREHLSPIHRGGTDIGVSNHQVPVTGKGNAADGWLQNQQNCAAASTVTARAAVDPIYALRLTTGGHPDNPAFDNPHAAQQRFEAETNAKFTLSQGTLSHNGIVYTEGGSDRELGPPLGVDYDITHMDTPDQRSEAIEHIEKAVDNGRPVPIYTTGVDAQGAPVAHELIVVGHDGDRLQVLNPWGYTMWVSEKDFVDGSLEKVAPGVGKIGAVMVPHGN